MYWSPNFLAVVFEKQDISQQVVARMQDLASEISKIFWGDTPGPLQPLPHPTPSAALAGRRGAQAPRCCDPNLGTPKIFSRGCAPGVGKQAT